MNLYRLVDAWSCCAGDALGLKVLLESLALLSTALSLLGLKPLLRLLEEAWYFLLEGAVGSLYTLTVANSAVCEGRPNRLFLGEE